MPDLRITRVVRADGSGSTEVFLSYLNAAAPSVAESIEGRGGRAKWPGSTVGAEGSGKLVDAVKATPGAIGHVSSDYVAREGLNAVSLRNRNGAWVAPRLDALGATIRAGGLFKHSLNAAPLIDLEGPGVWPIVTATYVVVPQAPDDLERAGRVLLPVLPARRQGRGGHGLRALGRCCPRLASWPCWRTSARPAASACPCCPSRRHFSQGCTTNQVAHAALAVAKSHYYRNWARAMSTRSERLASSPGGSRRRSTGTGRKARTRAP